MPAPLIRRADQLTIAVCLAVSIAGMWVWWFGQGGHRGGLVDIENAAPLDYRFLVDLTRAEWPELAQLPLVNDTQVAEEEGPQMNADKRG